MSRINPVIVALLVFSTVALSIPTSLRKAPELENLLKQIQDKKAAPPSSNAVAEANRQLYYSNFFAPPEYSQEYPIFVF
ncbi:unnamed protein product, partial [Mesorhabditis spiculigera]